MHSNALVKQDGIIDWPWKLLQKYRPEKDIELYNLIDDPEEKTNISLRNKAKTIELFSKLYYWKNLQLNYYKNPDYYQEYYPPRFVQNLSSEN